MKVKIPSIMSSTKASYPQNVEEPTDNTFTDGIDDSQESGVKVVKKKLHDRSRFNRCVSSSIGVIILAGVGTCLFLWLNYKGIRLRRAAASSNVTTLLSLAEVELHSTPDDCWMVLHGAVYDLSAYAPLHPSGPDYVWDRCGTDGTIDYDKFHKSVVLLEVVESSRVGVSSEAVNEQSVSQQEAEEKSSDDSEDGDSEDAAPNTSSPPPPNTTESQIDVNAESTNAPALAPVTAPVMAPVVVDPSPGSCWNLDQVAMHDSVDDCYYILYGAVFDFTEYIDKHPGGDEVMIDECGTDATKVYETAKKHDISLLEKKGGNDYFLGQQCLEVATSEVPVNNAEDTNAAALAPAAVDPSPGSCWNVDQVALHDSVDDCYYILYGAVYDFTEYIDKHPGGEEVMIDECGTDATQVYETAKKHDMQLLEKKGGNDYRIALACV